MVSRQAPGSSCHFFTIVARDTNDQTFAASRQRFLAEQGYAYTIVDGEDVLAAAEQRRRQDRLGPSRQLPVGEGPLAW